MPDIIYLRRGANGRLERSQSLKEPVVWSQTDLSDAMFGELFDEWSNITDIDDIEERLNLDTQYAIGRKICRELGAPSVLRTTKWLHLVPVTEIGDTDAIKERNEAFLDLFCRIPWNLVTRKDEENPIFLARDFPQSGSVTLLACHTSDGRARIRNVSNVRLPPFPRILLVIPLKHYADDDPTYGEEHLAALKESLVSYRDAGRESNITHVATFEDFERALTQGIAGEDADIVYFYGHGNALDNTSVFFFDNPDSEATNASEVDIDRIKLALRECVRKRGDIPLAAVWINACKGAAARGNSFLRSLSPEAGTVLTTRTLAPVEDSRAIAEDALKRIALDGEAPHVALRLVMNTCTYKPPVTSGRWAAPVVSVQYEYWSPLDTEHRPIEDVDSAGDFPVRLDRVSSLSRIERTLRKHFDATGAAPLSIGWRGDGEQRIDIFERRVADLLPERLYQWPTVIRRVELQFDSCSARNLTNHFFCSIWAGIQSERSYPEMKTPDMADVRRVINRLIAKETRALVLEHGPFTSVHISQIAQYMEFWRTFYQDLIPKDRRLVLAFGFKEETGATAGLEPRILHTFVRLGPVPQRELKLHLTAFGRFYRQTSTMAEAKAEQLMTEYDGSFLKIHAALERLAELHAWPQLRSKEVMDT
jgi:hypothetical protein